MPWTSPLIMMLVKAVGYAGISALLSYAAYCGLMQGGVAFTRGGRIENTATEHPYLFWSAISFSSVLSVGYGVASVLAAYGLLTMRRAKQDEQGRP